MQESSEETIKNDEEMNDYGDTVETRHKRHENFYRMKQNNDATNLGDSFCASDNLTMRKRSTQVKSPKK